MKKQFLFFACCAMFFMACNNATENKDAGQTKAQMDSAVNAQVAQKEAAMKASNDSMALAAEKAKADSLQNTLAAEKDKQAAHASSGGGTKTHKSETKPTTPPPPPPPPPPAPPAPKPNPRPGAH